MFKTVNVLLAGMAVAGLLILASAFSDELAKIKKGIFQQVFND